MQTIKSLVKNYTPKGLLRSLMKQYKETKGRRLSKQYQGDNVTCPCCGNSFSSFMDCRMVETIKVARLVETHKNTICPGCFSCPRHRIVCDYFDKNKDIFSNQPNILMVGAEYSIQKWFENHNISYKTADLFERTADFNVDITNTPFADESWSIIICNHVLEHVPDYKVAIKELRRILKKGGILELSVPTDRSLSTTYEDPSIITEEQRIEAFGQADHLRNFGSDFKEILVEIGFSVEVINGDDLPARHRTVVGPATYDDNRIYICKK